MITSFLRQRKMLMIRGKSIGSCFSSATELPTIHGNAKSDGRPFKKQKNFHPSNRIKIMAVNLVPSRDGKNDGF